jgi:hypothetical protein
MRGDLDDVWIGCTRQKMPSVFRAINALNETLISKLWIWDSLINIVPNDMFAHVRLVFSPPFTSNRGNSRAPATLR